MPTTVFADGRSKPILLRGRLVMGLLLFFQLLPVGAGAGSETEGSFLRQVVLVLFFLAAAFTISRFPKRWHMVEQSFPLTFAFLLLYAMLSVLWSDQVYVSFKRAIQLFGVALVAQALLVGGAGRWRIHRVAFAVLAVGMLLAVIFSAAFPSFAFSDLGLRGFMITKNNFGQMAALCVLFTVASLAMDRSRWTWLHWVLLAMAIAGLGLSRSVTAILSLGAAGLVVIGVELPRRLHSSWRLPTLVVCLLAIAGLFAAGVVIGFPTPTDAVRGATGLIGRDLTLTGRGYLWELMLQEFGRHPWFGTGYGGFWLGLDGRSGQVAYLVKWGYPGQAHNGYIDIVNELGIVGLVLLFAFMIDHAFSIRRLAMKDRALANTHLALFAMVVVLNIAEAAMMRTTNLMWMLMVASAFEVRWLARRPYAESRSIQSASPVAVL